MTIRYFTDIEFRSGVLITLGSDAAGDLYCRNQLGLLTRIAIGSNNQILTAVNGLPVWSSNRSPNGAAGGDLSGNYPNPVIANDVVTFAKFQNIATHRLLGRNTTGSGDMEELTAATVRTMLALGTAALLNTGVAAGNIPVLDANGKLDSSIVPAISITHFYGTVADQAARLAISASSIQPNDWIKQADTGVSYVLVGSDPSVNANWVPFGDASIVASDIISGVFAAARLGNGTASASTWLRGDQTWASITAADIASGTIATARLGSGSADNTKWLRGDQTWQSLGTAALLNTGVTSGNIPVLDVNGKVNNSVISAAAGDLSGSYPSLTIVNDAVTFAKFQNIATQRLLGRNTASSGDVEELTAATVRTILALGTAALLNTGVASGNVPVVQATGKLDSSIIPFVPTPLTNVTGTTQALAANNRYYANSASLVTFTLPTTAPQGSIIKICGVGAGGWRISQNAGQQIHFGNSSTTSGTGGRLHSTHQRDCVELECVVANTTWQVVNSVGAINVI